MSSPLPSIVLDAMAAVEAIGTEELAKLISVSRSHGAGDPSAEQKYLALSAMLRLLGFDSAVRKAGNLIC